MFGFYRNNHWSAGNNWVLTNAHSCLSTSSIFYCLPPSINTQLHCPYQIFYLSLELLGGITSHIFTPNDLLSFALIAKQFHTIIVPHHLHFRYIRCHPGCTDVQEAIVSRDIWAQHVRRLELGDYNGDIQLIPECLNSEPRTHNRIINLSLLKGAISRMVNLYRFTS